MFLTRIAVTDYLAMRCIYSLRQSYILILPKLFYLQTSVKSQRSYIGRCEMEYGPPLNMDPGR